MLSPLVSVIVPNYNHHLYLPERIESILAQEFQNFELILLDDCSPDSSVEVLERYRSNSKVSHICINEVNSGSTFRQWAKGISLARGEYIWIAESDDSADPCLLGTIVKHLLETPSAVLGFCNSFIIDGQGKNCASDLDKDDNCQKEYTVHDGMEFLRRKMIYSNRIYNASAVVFKKSAWKGVDQEYLAYRFMGDQIFWMELLRQGNIVWVHRKYNRFRVHENKVSPKAYGEGLDFKEHIRFVSYVKRRYSFSSQKVRMLNGAILYGLLRSQKIVPAVKRSLLKNYLERHPMAFMDFFFYSAKLVFHKVGVFLGLCKRYPSLSYLTESEE